MDKTIESTENQIVSNIKENVEIPTWFPVKAAAQILAVSQLHVHILIRDGILDSRTTQAGVEVKAADVLAFRPKALASQQEFASNVAHPDSLRNCVVQMCA